MCYVGVDYHKKYSYKVVKNEQGRQSKGQQAGQISYKDLNFSLHQAITTQQTAAEYHLLLAQRACHDPGSDKV